MKIQCVSDLHLEHYNGGVDGVKNVIISLARTQAPIIVLAGDICAYDEIVDYLSIICDNFKHVIYTAGNHEYYFSDLTKTEKEINKALNKNSNLIYLNNSIETVENQRFVGCTLWFTYDPLNTIHYGLMSDSELNHTSISELELLGEFSADYLYQVVRPDDIVVTHHIPHMSLVQNSYKGSALNRFYVNNNAVKVLEKNMPKLWISGHTHSSFDKVINETRCICNPRGYRGLMLNGKFKADMLVEV